MNKLIVFCLAAAGMAGLPLPSAQASAAGASLPPVVHENLTVVVGVHHHRHYHTVRRVYYRHGYRVVRYRRVYY